MFQVVDEFPLYIRQRYPSAQLLSQALYSGEVIRDQYGRFYLREEIQPQPIDNPYGCAPVYMAEPTQKVAPPFVQSNILDFSFFMFENIRGYYAIAADGYVSRLINAEDVARGIGLTTAVKHNDRPVAGSCNQVQYTEGIRWSTFNEYAQSSLPYIDIQRELNMFTFPINKDSYIPFELALMVAINCRSEKARQFHGFLVGRFSREVSMMIDSKYKEIKESLEKQIEEQNKVIRDQGQTIVYQEEFLNKQGLFYSTELAKKFNLTPQVFNKIFEKLGYIYKVNGQWVSKAPFDRIGMMTFVDIQTPKGIVTESLWTETGRQITFKLLTDLGIQPGVDNSLVVKQLLDK